MDFKEIASGVKIPAIGLGTWGIGGGHSPDTSRDEEDIESLRLGIELQMTHIDTAERYGAGHCEEVVAQAIEPYDRKDLFLTTKVWHDHLKRGDLIKSMNASLKRLQQDYVDLYLIHWPNPEVPLKETMEALEYCAEEGYTRFIGVSNFSPELVAEAQSYLKEHRLVANQVKYSLTEQGPRAELLPYCRENDVILIAYTPLAKGNLARPGNLVLDELAEKYGKTQAQISLNWLILQEKVIAIPKATNPDHLRDNIGATDWEIDTDDLQRLTNSFI